MSDEAPSQAPGKGPREERYRLASIAAGIPLVLLIAHIVLPVDGRRTLLGEAMSEPAPLLVVMFLMAWPILAGARSLSGGLRRRLPGLAAYAVPAVIYTLASGAMGLLLSAAFLASRQARREPAVPLSAVACALAVYLLLRGFRRDGWERWAQLVVGLWLAHGTISAVLLFGEGSLDLAFTPGGWVLLFDLGMLAPIAAWILWPRRGETSLRRSWVR